MTRNNPSIEEQKWAHEASTIHNATVGFSGEHGICDKAHNLEHYPNIELIDRPFAAKEIGYSTPKAPRKLKKLMKSVKRLKIFGAKDVPEMRGSSSDATKNTVEFLTSSEEIDSQSGTRGIENTNTVEIRYDQESLDTNSRSTNLNERHKNQLGPVHKISTDETRDTFKWDSPTKTVEQMINLREKGDPYALGRSRGFRQYNNSLKLSQDSHILNKTTVNKYLGKPRQNIKQQLPKNIHSGTVLHDDEGDEAKTTVSVLTMTSPISAGEKKFFTNRDIGDGNKKQNPFCRHETYDIQDLPQRFCQTYIPNPQIENAMRLLGLDTMTGTDNSSRSSSCSSESIHEKLNIEHVHINSFNQIRSTSALTSSSEEYSDSDLSSTANEKRFERLKPFRSALTIFRGRIAECLTPIIDSPPTHYERRHVFGEEGSRYEM